MSGSYQPHGRRNVAAVTAAYTVTTQDWGTLFTTSGATQAIVFTLPAPTAYTGEQVSFFNAADQSMTVKSSGANMVVFNDITASSVAYSTSSAKAGAGFRVTSDGSKWLVEILPAVTGAATVGLGIAKSAPVTIGT